MRKAIVLGTLFAVGCGGGTGTAEFKIIDGPPAGVTSVRIYVLAMQAHVVDMEKGKGKKGQPDDATVDDVAVIKKGETPEPNKWMSLPVDKEIELVGKTDGAEEVLGQLDLPEGKITQLRLILDTTKTTSNKATFNGTDCALDLGKIPQKGIKINHVFKAFDIHAGAKHDITVDFDLGESMKAKGSCFELEGHLKLHKVKHEGEEVDVKAT